MNYRIIENLESLENLTRNDFLELSNNIEEYYKDYNFHGSLIHLAQLFKIIGYEDFPNGFRLIKIIANFIDNRVCVSNQYEQYCYEEDSRLYITPLLDITNTENYYNKSKAIKQNKYNSASWKQKLYNIDTYTKCNNYAFDNQCTVSIYNEEIINLFNDIYGDITTIDLLIAATKKGGNLVDCYEDDFESYVKAGFMPISICHWDDRQASKQWLKANNMIDNNGNIKKELLNRVPDSQLNIPRMDKIYFIYTGTHITLSFNRWKQQVEYSDSYHDAKEKRNLKFNQMKRMREELNG